MAIFVATPAAIAALNESGHICAQTIIPIRNVHFHICVHTEQREMYLYIQAKCVRVFAFHFFTSSHRALSLSCRVESMELELRQEKRVVYSHFSCVMKSIGLKSIINSDLIGRLNTVYFFQLLN